MITLEHTIYYQPDDESHRGDRVRTVFCVDGDVTLSYGENKGDTTVDAIFYGFVKAYKNIYGDDEVEVIFRKCCMPDWDYLDEDWWDYDEDDT